MPASRNHSTCRSGTDRLHGIVCGFTSKIKTTGYQENDVVSKAPFSIRSTVIRPNTRADSKIYEGVSKMLDAVMKL